jgi:hypothetical protein
MYAKAFSAGLYNEKEAPKQSSEFDCLPFFDKNNAQVFMDIEIGEPGAEGNKREKVIFELFTK